MNKNDRYTRLKSLEEFGLEIKWEELHTKRITIIGVGGVGSIVSEMLTRCGIGELVLIDMDAVDVVNLNRLFFRTENIGKSKVEVAKNYLLEINPEVEIRTFHIDVCLDSFEEELELIIRQSDLIVSGLDNLPARLYINQKCVALKKEYIDSGASRSGLGGYVHLVKPGITACYNCTGSIDLGTKEEGEPCTASLPSTIAIIGSLVTEIALKHLLEFGSIPDYIGFNALNDRYLIQKMKKDPRCYICGEMQYTAKEKEESLQQINEMTKGKTINELIENLQAEVEKNGKDKNL